MDFILEDEEEPGRVRIVHIGGRIAFQDPDSYPRPNLFISGREALGRLTYDPALGEMVDSFGNTAGVASMALPRSGITVPGRNVDVEYIRLPEDNIDYAPRNNEEIIERIITVDQDGNMSTHELSYGRGEKYDPSKYGAKWVTWTSDALGLEEGEHLTTRELNNAVLYKEFQVRRVG